MFQQTLRTIRFHGFMAEKYGEIHRLAAENMMQVMSGLRSRFGVEFEADVRENSWHIIDGEHDLDERELRNPLEKAELHFVPAVVGASSVLRIVLGVILVIVGVIFDQPWLIGMGASLAIGGVAEMLTPKPSGPSQNQTTKSFVYDAATNITSQGGPVPLAYGRIQRVSSAVISTDFSSDQLLTNPTVVTPTHPYRRP